MPACRTMLASAAALTLTAAPAFAHHSFAMFDSEKNVTLAGTVKAFEWANPHCWIVLLARNPGGEDVEWQLEGASPNALARNGWRRASLKPGDKATIVIHPLKDGSNGGSWVTVRVNGREIGDTAT